MSELVGSKFCVECGCERGTNDKLGVLLCDECHTRKDSQMKTWVDFVEDSMDNQTLAEGLMRVEPREPEAVCKYFNDVGYAMTIQECERIVKLMNDRKKHFGLERFMY